MLDGMDCITEEWGRGGETSGSSKKKNIERERCGGQGI